MSDGIILRKSYAFALGIVKLCKELQRDKKLSIALKEARETGYWLNLLRDSNYLPNNSFDELNKECNEIVKILSSIILTTKQKYFTSENATHNS